MNEYNDPNAAFNGIVNNSFQENPQVTPAQPYTDPHPYGPPATPTKTGLTPRGKAALAIAATVVAGGALMGWQSYASTQAATELKAKELSIQEKQLELKKIQALKAANESQAKTQKAADQARQKMVDSCVEADKGLIGKQMGVTYRSVLKDCQAEFPDASGTGDDMQEAASARATDGDGSINTVVLVGGGTLAIGLIWGVSKFSRRPEPAPVVYRPY